MSKLNGFLAKVGNVVKNSGGDILGIGAKIATGNIGGAIADVTNLLHKENTPQARELLDELEIRRSEFEKEMFALEVKDRESARDREIEIAKTGGVDWLMYASGVTALGTFVLMVFAVIFMSEQVGDSSLFHQLMGIIEGVALTVFAYYFGSSKGSKDKDK